MRQSSHDDENALILKAAAGDKHAFGKLYDLYSGKIFTYCLYWLGLQMDAGKLTGSVFLKVWESLPSFGKRGGNMHFRVCLAVDHTLYHPLRSIHITASIITLPLLFIKLALHVK